MSVVLSDLSFSFPNGRVVLIRLSASFNAGRTGLIGQNGSGKSTLLRLIAGALRPTSGSVTATGEVGYLPQDLALDTSATVASLLGIAAARDAIRAIEAGSVDPAAFDAVGDGWDIEDRAREQLARLGLSHIGLDDPVGRLSGGEAVLTALSARLLRRPAVLLLDEPTNNLDLDARRRLYAAVEAWPGVLVVVSHDRALLSLVDQVADLSGGGLRMYGGNLEAYEAMLATEQAAAQRAVSAAEADVRREKRDLLETQVKQARRDRMGRQLAASGSIPRIVAGGRKRAAEVSAGKGREVALARIAGAKERLADAADALRDDAVIRISLPGTAVPAGRTVLTAQGLDAPWAPWHADPGRPGGNGNNGHRRRKGRRAGRLTRRPRPARGADRPRPGARRAHRAERGRQDNVAPRAGRTGRPGRAARGGCRPAQRGGRLPAAAARHPRRRADRGRQRARGRAPRDRQRRAGRAGEVPVPRCAGRPAGGHAVRRRAVPRGTRRAPARGSPAAAAAARRADQQPGHGVRQAAVAGAVLLPRRAARGEPRRAVPALAWHHPLAAPGTGRPPRGRRPAVTARLAFPARPPRW